jgi:hypothetical protein
MVCATIVSEGRVIGCWTHASASLGSEPELFAPGADEEAVRSALARFTRFLDG